ncbi:hypothetical protein KP509_32G077300 [Ceratopteris richardii]|uniref:Uncharacterized protein n=1 Tax=Ceratopteris richardii TaxID=49495 RepID=A0A8T2QWF9_CERRI|nr:hypothetical protein KP509_32G077300 [Ceratopteris richardii]KAH7287848.1 hypothetical protein KP509_32G077300 [Ceratopteris richardii]
MPDISCNSINSSVELIVGCFEEETRNAGKIQMEILDTILKRNASTSYLKIHGLDGRIDSASFKASLPIITHDHLKPYLDRIVEGDRSPILIAEPIQALAASSGTTCDGQPKILPLYKELHMQTVNIAKISLAYRARTLPLRPGGRVLELVFSGKLSITTGGLTLCTATTHLFRSPEYKMRQNAAPVSSCSPDEVIQASDNRQAMYCHLLCGLIFRDDIEIISSTFAYTIVEAFCTFVGEFSNLCNDIQYGVLNPCISDPSLRKVMGKLLEEPNPPSAEKLRSIFAKLQNCKGVIPEIWPNCKYIYSIMTGSMQSYVERLTHYAGSLPLVCGDYGSTETWIGVNINPTAPPEKVSFTVIPSFAYYEFIPYKDDGRNLRNNSQSSVEEETVSLTEVKVDQYYELVVTTFGGLYRYKLGDIVRVTGFMNESPQLEFVCRKNAVLMVHTDKTTERDIQKAVRKGLEVLQLCCGPSAEIIEFTSFVDLSSTKSPGHYVIVWELKEKIHVIFDTNIATGMDDLSGGRGHQSIHKMIGLPGTFTDVAEEQKAEELGVVLRVCATVMDLSFRDAGYAGPREQGTIGALELCIVRAGTFREMTDRYLSNGISALTQYKTPRCVRSAHLRSFLRARSRASFFSAAYASCKLSLS